MMPLKVSHSFQYELGMKEIFASNKQTPFFIRQQCGPRLASVFRHIGSFDSRDDTVFPTQGYFVRNTSEVIGDRLSQYGAVKGETHAEVNVPLFAGMSLQFVGRMGKIYENQRVMKPLPIDSLFFLGGPQSLRGFETARATPVEEGVPRGTRAYWATGVHLWAPLPFNSYFGNFGDLFRTHFFYNVGNCETFTLGELRMFCCATFSYKNRLFRQRKDRMRSRTGFPHWRTRSHRVQLLLSTIEAENRHHSASLPIRNRL